MNAYAATGDLTVNVPIKNPLSSANTLPEFIGQILHAVVIIGVPIVAVAIIYCGFLFVTASGNTEKLSKAKTGFLWTVIGGAILLGAWVLANALGDTINQL